MLIDLIKDSIIQNIGPLRPAPKGFQKRNCPLCHTQGHGKDTRNRFGIQFNPQSIITNCFNCGFSATYTEDRELSKSFKFFLKQINVSNEFIKHIEFEIFKQKNKIQEFRDGYVSTKINDKIFSVFQKWKTSNLPKNSLRITEWLEHELDDPNFLNVVNYAIGRGIYDLENFYWSPEKVHNLNQRLIIPYYYNNNIVGFTSRLFYNTDDKSIPKYYQQSPSDFIYNLDLHQDRSYKYILVNEGVLDAWCVNGISVLGEVGQTKIDIINRLQKDIIVCPDRDKKGGDLVEIAIKNSWAVSFPQWDIDIKDAAQASQKYGRLLTTHSIISSAVTNKEKIQLLWNIQQAERQKRIKYE